MSAIEVLKEMIRWRKKGIREFVDLHNTGGETILEIETKAISKALLSLEQKEKLLAHANNMVDILEKDYKKAQEQNDHDLEAESIEHHTKLLLYAWQYVKNILEGE